MRRKLVEFGRRLFASKTHGKIVWIVIWKYWIWHKLAREIGIKIIQKGAKKRVFLTHSIPLHTFSRYLSTESTLPISAKSLLSVLGTFWSNIYRARYIASCSIKLVTYATRSPSTLTHMPRVSRAQNQNIGSTRSVTFTTWQSSSATQLYGSTNSYFDAHFFAPFLVLCRVKRSSGRAGEREWKNKHSIWI